MKTLIAAMALAAAAQAQPAPPVFASAADIRALIARAAKVIKPGQLTLALPIVGSDGRTARLEYRQATGPSSIHETAVELFVVLEGAGTLTTGGTLAQAERRPGGNLSGSAIEGGTARRIGPGDVFIIPAGMAHGFSAINGKLVLISQHMPAVAPANP